MYLLLALLCLFLFPLSAIAQPLTVTFSPDHSILIQAPDAQVALIDSGPKGSGISQRLKKRGISKIDYAFLSHPHADHYGGFLDLVHSFKVSQFFDTGCPAFERSYLDLLDSLGSAKVPLKIARQGQVIDLGGGVNAEILWPTDPLRQNTPSDPHANSLVLMLSYKQIKILLLGDLDQIGWQHWRPSGYSVNIIQWPRSLVAPQLQAPEMIGMRAGKKKVSRPIDSDAWELQTDGMTIQWRKIPFPHSIAKPSKIDLNLGHAGEIEALPGMNTARTRQLFALRPILKWEQVIGIKGFPRDRLRELQATALLGTHADTRSSLSPKIDLNRASQELLESLPGIGPAMAKRIISARPFHRIDELRRVKGIGVKRLEKLRPLVFVSEKK